MSVTDQLKGVSKMKSSIKVCKIHYKDNCHNCPLRPSCCRPVGPGREAYDAWALEKENLADKILAAN